MSILHSFILGIIEGLTEFLPISSTFHLIFASQFLRIVQSEYVKMFEVVIQAGAICSLLFLYLKSLLRDRTLTLKVVLSFLPTALVGALLYKIIKSIFFGSNILMIIAFILVGLIFLVIEHLVSTHRLTLKKTLSELTYQESIMIGFVQSLAVIPGVSRAGSVIVGMMSMGYRRDESARYTFLLSLPTILAAATLDLYKGREILISLTENLSALTVGFVTAFIVAYMVVKWLLKYLSTHTLKLFAWYRFVVAIFLIFTLWL